MTNYAQKKKTLNSIETEESNAFASGVCLSLMLEFSHMLTIRNKELKVLYHMKCGLHTNHTITITESW